MKELKRNQGVSPSTGAASGVYMMNRTSLPKKDRQRLLIQRLKENPFYTDEELAVLFNVSIQTIRLDRWELGVPEMRERTRALAQNAYKKIRSVSEQEIIGELVDVDLGKSGVSVLETTPAMGLKRTGIIRGHHIFAQANSLAVAIIDADVVLTGMANVKYLRPVHAGERLLCRAHVREQQKNKYFVSVVGTIEDERVFEGEFVVFAMPGRDKGGTG